MFLEQISSTSRIEHHRPWPRIVVDTETWRLAGTRLADGAWSLVSLWGDEDAVHAAIRDHTSGEMGVLSFACPDGRFPSLAQFHAPAMRLERTIGDLWGLVAQDTPDPRPWLDHGRWDIMQPLGRKLPALSKRDAYTFLPAEGESLTQIPVGPVHAGIIEPGFFRFTANGETVVRLEERFGYTHKGIESLMLGSDLAHGLKLAGRACGDSTLAYAYAFARAAEAALGIEAPPRALWLRALMAELERLANHFGDVGAICNDAAFAIMLAQCSVVREQILRSTDHCFGHRMMRDAITVGGVSRNLSKEGEAALRALVDQLTKRLPRLIELYDHTASLQNRTVGTGILQAELAHQYGCGGYIGRASGRNFDAREALAYAPYDTLHFEVPVLGTGDVNARIWIRIREIEQSLSLLGQILDGLPDGPVQIDISFAPGELREGAALVEGFRGDVFAWLRLNPEGTIARAHLRDPSWFQWPLLEAAIEGNIVADFPLCNKSFNCAYSGHDL